MKISLNYREGYTSIDVSNMTVQEIADRCVDLARAGVKAVSLYQAPTKNPYERLDHSDLVEIAYMMEEEDI